MLNVVEKRHLSAIQKVSSTLIVVVLALLAKMPLLVLQEMLFMYFLKVSGLALRFRVLTYGLGFMIQVLGLTFLA